MFTQIDRRLIINRSQSASVSLRKRGSEALMGSTSFRPTLGARAAKRLREVLGGESANTDSPRDEP
jgi:hypothetical protein